jgi:sirohydrochlorin ferrochelatase
VLPLFFAEGRHLLHDVPEIIDRLSEQYPDITINLLPAIGCQDVFWEALGIMIRSEYDNRQSAPHDHREASGYTH